jgi:hypothetical protein
MAHTRLAQLCNENNQTEHKDLHYFTLHPSTLKSDIKKKNLEISYKITDHGSQTFNLPPHSVWSSHQPYTNHRIQTTIVSNNFLI